MKVSARWWSGGAKRMSRTRVCTRICSCLWYLWRKGSKRTRTRLRTVAMECAKSCGMSVVSYFQGHFATRAQVALPATAGSSPLALTDPGLRAKNRTSRERCAGGSRWNVSQKGRKGRTDTVCLRNARSRYADRGSWPPGVAAREHGTMAPSWTQGSTSVRPWRLAMRSHSASSRSQPPIPSGADRIMRKVGLVRGHGPGLGAVALLESTQPLGEALGSGSRPGPGSGLVLGPAGATRSTLGFR
mmetsp:Transcript_76630/g.135337  ORF Transcript_76630/g.135337 Transcript_76630/m.135337 type:complete len:244 (-) Transcript_76630:362-1093(-)